MDLNRLSENLRLQFVPLLMVGLAIAFIISGLVAFYLYFGQVRFGQEPLPPNLSFNSRSFANENTIYKLEIADKDFSKLPRKVSTYKANFNITEANLKEIGAIFGVQGTVTKQGEAILLKNNNQHLLYSPQNGQINYSVSIDFSTLTQGGFSEPSLTAAALDFTKLVKSIPQPTTVKAIKYVNNSLEPVEVPPDEAFLAIVTLASTFQDGELLYQTVITLDKNNRILNFSYYPLIVSEGESKSFPKKQINEVKADLKSLNLKLVYFGDDVDVLESDLKVTSAQFKSISLAYIGQPTTGLVQPVYLLEGIAQVGNQTTPVQAVLPAIKGVKINP